MKSKHLVLVKRSDMRPVGRMPNDACRVREHLTEDELGKLFTALRANRHGHRDWLIGLMIYRLGYLAQIGEGTRDLAATITRIRNPDQPRGCELR